MMFSNPGGPGASWTVALAAGGGFIFQGSEDHSLASEIEEFIQRADVPSYLSGAVDAVRSIDNFAAHPSKDKNTGEIANVEPGEAHWLLEVIDALFDFAFVQPKRLEERRNKLNVKLQSMGKPPMKS